MMYKLVFFVPESHIEIAKAAAFEAGAGRMGNYEQCCWQVAGTGQFRPLKGSKPFVGEQGVLEKLTEFRVEMVCEDAHIRAVLRALREAHPYEEPAIDVWPLTEAGSLDQSGGIAEVRL